MRWDQMRILGATSSACSSASFTTGYLPQLASVCCTVHDGVKRRRVGMVYAGHGGAWVITLRDNSSGRPHGPSRGGGADEQESFYGVEPWVYFQVEQQTAQLLERVKVQLPPSIPPAVDGPLHWKESRLHRADGSSKLAWSS
jgi:hypothetical protein